MTISPTSRPAAAHPDPARYLRPVLSRLALVGVLLATLLLSASPAGAATSRIWATVNVCDTRKAPDTIGLRASMPGITRKGATMRMRFQVQYRNAAGRWVAGTGLDTGFLSIGSANVTSRQAGHSFRVKAPAKGGSYLMRGLVTFQWRTKRGTLLSAKKRLTTSGHKSTAGADPAGYSAATCVIKG